MMLIILFSLLAAGVACAYIPWGERVVRVSNMVAGGAAIVAAGLLAHETWSVDATITMSIALIVPAYAAALLSAERILAHEHLAGSMSLMKFRTYFAALHVVAAAFFAVSHFTHTAVALGGAVFFLALCGITLRFCGEGVSRPFAMMRDGAGVAVLSIAFLRIFVSADTGLQEHIRMALMVIGLVALVLAVVLVWKKQHAIGEAALLFTVGMSLMAIGFGTAGLIAAAMMWFALLATSIFVHVGANIDWGRSMSHYLAIGLPPSALAIPYFIAFGYGLQLHPWMTGGAMVIYAVFLWRGTKNMYRSTSGTWKPKREYALVAIPIVLNIALALALSTPQVMLLIISGVGAITPSQF